MIKAIVGAGGKTTLLKQLAKEYRAQGKRVFVTTSTHMMGEEDTEGSECAETIIERLEREGYVMAGSSCGEKIKALPQQVYEQVCEKADVVLIEADGSKHLPLKYPGEGEPVIYQNVEEILVVCGMHGLNGRAKDVIHRAELACKELGIDEQEIIKPEHIQRLVMKGYVEPLRQVYEGKTIKIEPRGEKGLYQRVIASLLKWEQEVSLVEEAWFEPQPQLIICGGGHVSKELVTMAACLDFKIKVMDDREEFANKERFPMADEVICDSFDHLEQYMEPNAYYVIVTREHKDDFNCVMQILQHSYRYLGMIGSKKKVGKTFENLRKEGISEEQIQSIFAPVGLDIRAVTPAEIAISILAQIIKEKNKDHAASVSRELLHTNEKGVLCIIIEKIGSSPRGVGSMMLVTKQKIYDSIGGGAVEFAAIEDAKHCEKVMIKDYCLNSREKDSLDMICGGSNKVLFVPI